MKTKNNWSWTPETTQLTARLDFPNTIASTDPRSKGILAPNSNERTKFGLGKVYSAIEEHTAPETNALRVFAVWDYLV